MRINGGERAGNNLFHSFDEFNLPEGMEAIFENGLDIENIFTRITGDSISNVDGILSAQGEANLFLINPNGIVFGDGAAINIGGSFIATTADSIEFADGTSFAANDTSTDPILTVDEPSGLTFDGQPGAIEVYGGGNEITPNAGFAPTSIGTEQTGLSVNQNESLILSGGEINVSGGRLSTKGGQISLNSVGSGQLELNQVDNQWVVGTDSVSFYEDINLSQQTLINAGGAIQIAGLNINVTDGSTILIQNQQENALGNLSVNALETITLSGTSPDGNVSSGVLAEALNIGKGADISIKTSNLVLSDGARLSASTYSDAPGGNVSVNAINGVELMENSAANPSREGIVISFVGTGSFGSGNAGDFQLSTSRLRSVDGGTLGSTNFDTGIGGNTIVNADRIEMEGVNANRFAPSSLGSTTAGSGDAGNTTVNTSQLRLLEGGTVYSTSLSTGTAGNLAVNASDFVEVRGSELETQSSISSSVIQSNEGFQNRFNTPDIPQTTGGAITVTSPRLNISDGGTISVRNDGLGNAGTLSVNADRVDLDNSGSITAASVSGRGGNININADELQINDQSIIEATAENQGGGGNININTTNLTAKKDSAISANADDGDGGNIIIDAETILGLNNSDITANAVGGNGGNITIDSDFMVGLEERSRLTPFNDITATSEFGIDGTVTINTPDSNLDEQVYAGFKTYTVPQNRELLKQRCLNLKNPRGKIVDVGRAGVPANPNNFFDDEEVIAIEGIEDNGAKTDTEAPVWVEGDPIEEPNAVKVGADGETYLVTQTEVSNTSIEGVESEICTKATAPHRK